jgi:hypothetical protein
VGLNIEDRSLKKKVIKVENEKRNRKKMFWFKNEFQKRGLKSGLPKEIRKLLNLVEPTSLKKSLEISKCPKEIRKGSLKKG